MNTCEVCRSPYGELHHIVFRSQCKHMINIKMNHIYLCAEHHRGNSSPHRNREIDLRYKRKLQNKLFEIFDREYVTVKEIKEKLCVTDTVANKIVKTLRIFKEGYRSEDVIRVLMGDRLY